MEERTGNTRRERKRENFPETYMLNTLTAAKGVAQVFLYFSMVGASESEEQETRFSIFQGKQKK